MLARAERRAGSSTAASAASTSTSTSAEAGGVYYNHVAAEAQQSRARRWGCAWCGHRPRRWQLINLACFFLAATACVYVARSQSWRPLDVRVGEAGMRRARKLELLVLGRNTDASGLSHQLQRDSPPHTLGEAQAPTYDLALLEQDRDKCPLEYERQSFEDVRDYKAWPYLLGGFAKPVCHNCGQDNLWSHFCQYQSHGKICPDWLKWKLMHDFVTWGEQGNKEMKALLTLTPCDLFPFVRDRTLWIVGDSMALEWAKAVQCFLYEMWDLEMRDLTTPPPGRPYGWCATFAQGGRLCFVRGNTGDEFVDEALPILPRLGASTTDVMVLNFAVWSNKDEQYEGNMTRFREYYRAHKHELPHAIWRDSPAQHFDRPDGDYRWPVPTNECKEIRDLELLPDGSLFTDKKWMQTTAEGGWRNKVASPVVEALGIPVMHTWNVTTQLWAYHTHFNFEKPGDCTHMCHPSAYQYWVFELVRTFERLGPNWGRHGASMQL